MTDRRLHTLPAQKQSTPLVKEQSADDGVRWLSLLVRDGLLTIVRGIETRYQIKSKHDCPKCGWRS